MVLADRGDLAGSEGEVPLLLAPGLRVLARPESAARDRELPERTLK